MDSNLHFLVVDDVASMRNTVIDQLTALGYQTFSQAGDGQQALERLKAGDIDIVVTDWTMPQLNGFQLLKAIRARAAFAHLPVLMVTAQTDSRCVLAARRAGADAYLLKPVQRIELLEALADLAERGRIAGLAGQEQQDR